MSYWPKCPICSKRYVRDKSVPQEVERGAIELIHKCKSKPKSKGPAKVMRQMDTDPGGRHE